MLDIEVQKAGGWGCDTSTGTFRSCNNNWQQQQQAAQGGPDRRRRLAAADHALNSRKIVVHDLVRDFV